MKHAAVVLCILLSAIATSAAAPSKADAPRLTIQTTATGHAGNLSWNPSPTAGVTYNVYSGVGSGKESSTPVNSAPITGTSYVDTTSPGLVSGNNVCWYIKAFLASNPVGSQYSAASNESCGIVPFSAPVAPVQNPVQTSQAIPFNPLAMPASCLTSKPNALSFLNTPLPYAQAGQFELTFSATPSSAPADAVTGLSQGVAAGYANLAAIVRFNPTSGIIDAYNSTGYSEVVQMKYAAGTTYRITFVVNVPTQTYSAYVNGNQIASNYGFRVKATSLSNVAMVSETGTETLCAYSAV